MSPAGEGRINRAAMRLFSACAIATALVGFTATNALAANLVDGSVTASGQTCSWTNGSTTADPPSALTINAPSINPPGGNLSCSGSAHATLNNSPNVTFNDTSGTATADVVDVTVSVFGQN